MPPWWLRDACLAALTVVLAFAWLIGAFDAATPMERALSAGTLGMLLIIDTISVWRSEK